MVIASSVNPRAEPNITVGKDYTRLTAVAGNNTAIMVPLIP